MEIKNATAYELGQRINEKGLKGIVVQINAIVYSEEIQDVEYILDNGGKVVI